MNPEYKNILITGATGSLGKQLCAELVTRGHKPIAHCRQSSNQDRIKPLGIEIRIADLRRFDQMMALVKGIDAIIHTAAMVNFRGDRLTQFTGVNTMGAANLYQVASDAGVKRFVQVSSIAAIGAADRSKAEGPLNENSPFNLHHLKIPYIQSKHAAEEELLRLANESRTELVIVNPAIIVAPSRSGDDRSRARKLMSRPLLPGIPNQLNLVDIRDIIPAIINALEHGKHKERYLLSGENLTMKQLIRMVSERVAIKPRLIPLPKWLPMTAAHFNVLTRILTNRPVRRLYPDLVRMLNYDWIYDSSKAQTELGFTPRPLTETLDDLLNNRVTLPSHSFS